MFISQAQKCVILITEPYVANYFATCHIFVRTVQLGTIIVYVQ